MILVDTTVLADLLFNDGPEHQATWLLQAVDPEWACLGLAIYELGNVALKCVRFGSLDPTIASLALKSLDSLLVDVLHTIDPEAIFEIAAQRNLSFYDAAHVWLAITKNLPLYSRDRKLLSSSQDVARAMPGQ